MHSHWSFRANSSHSRRLPGPKGELWLYCFDALSSERITDTASAAPIGPDRRSRKYRIRGRKYIPGSVPCIKITTLPPLGAKTHLPAHLKFALIDLFLSPRRGAEKVTLRILLQTYGTTIHHRVNELRFVHVF
jgi:hypothetical protein